MKKLVLSIAMLSSALTASAQTPTTQISTFEDVTNLPNFHNKVYNDSTGGGGFTSRNAFFPTQWDTSYGGYWSTGWAASTYYDTTTAGYPNLYGCAAYKGYANSNTFAVGTTAGNLTIRLTDSLIGKTVSGVYVCNSTYAYKSMKNGDTFGDTAFSAKNKDWFKLTIRNYHGGVLAADSAEVYLADFRYADTTNNYILKTWMWVDLTSLGNTDSLVFFLHSTENNTYGMMTPAFFCIDNLTLSTHLDTTGLGIKNYLSENDLNVYPNPTVSETEVVYNTTTPVPVNMKLVDLLGNEIVSQRAQSFAGINKFKMDISYLPAGVYYITLNAGSNILTKKLIKQ
jgi:uncharacterized protein DUF4465/type IX secretion system substrate protein